MSTNQALAVSYPVTKYSETEKAQMFMADLRLAQANKRRLLSGRNNLSNAQHVAIKHAVSSINVSRNFNDNSAPAAFKALLERFEEMGRRVTGCLYMIRCGLPLPPCCWKNLP